MNLDTSGCYDLKLKKKEKMTVVEQSLLLCLTLEHYGADHGYSWVSHRN